ncbi:MAG TPA: T9SS type A sorting domain-containing protein [Bacteroidia bacterium]|nr:T9SS type A sorting domain-containing protein [Bacteroidia bacterium]
MKLARLLFLVCFLFTATLCPAQHFLHAYTNRSIASSHTELNVSSNPAQDGIHISLNRNAITRISLLDNNGHAVHFHAQEMNTTEEEVDLNNLAPGAYFLTVETDAGEILHENIVKK